MIAVRIGLEMRMAIMGSSAYFDRYGVPKTPQDLTSHSCAAADIWRASRRHFSPALSVLVDVLRYRGD